MDRRTFMNTLPALTFFAGTTAGFNDKLKPIKLVKPQLDGGKSVLASLKERKTIKRISSKKLSPQTLSNLLWAAFGVNREKEPYGGPGRTAASASNSQEIDLYVALSKGVYLYRAMSHTLIPVVPGEFRRKSGRRTNERCPINIFFVVDKTKYKRASSPDTLKSYYYVATGLIAQNVYLFAASQGLAAHFHTCDTKGTAAEFKLRPEQQVLFSQTVGYA